MIIAPVTAKYLEMNSAGIITSSLKKGYPFRVFMLQFRRYGKENLATKSKEGKP